MRGVSRRVPAASGDARLLDGVDLALGRGEVLHIVGPSGAGKSSLIRLINRLDEPSGGRIEVLGRPLADWRVRELRRRVAMVFQESTLLGMSVRDNLTLPFELAREVPDDLDRRIDGWLERTELDREVLERDATALSVGQKQRVALARALIGEPEMLLMDEPTSGLDPRTAARLLDRVSELCRERRLTLVMVTHRLE
ncbi:MAG TPA: ATP-binding cassette domain-containing protein, partial [Candidatus Polarisedimenticolaceae bacterium]|nr:ATP-binding cassette domain-containing protein [Candidatus Polarisedimenticolaceae bacterium]